MKVSFEDPRSRRKTRPAAIIAPSLARIKRDENITCPVAEFSAADRGDKASSKPARPSPRRKAKGAGSSGQFVCAAQSAARQAR